MIDMYFFINNCWKTKGENKMKKLSPSLLSADFANLEQQIKLIEQLQVPYLHLDVMDGVFVPNISIGIPVIKSIRKVSKMVFDVHLMIVEPEKYVEAFYKAGADIINFHAEATKDIAGTIKKIKDLGVKAGITLKPATDVSAIEDYLSELDLVLIMSVEPGFGGQKFMPKQLSKVKELAKIKKEKNLNFEIEIDGGIDIQNVKTVLDAGVDVVVAGSAVFGAKDIQKAVEGFSYVFKEYEA